MVFLVLFITKLPGVAEVLTAQLNMTKLIKEGTLDVSDI